jgi:hypothetical protein
LATRSTDCGKPGDRSKVASTAVAANQANAFVFGPEDAAECGSVKFKLHVANRRRRCIVEELRVFRHRFSRSSLDPETIELTTTLAYATLTYYRYGVPSKSQQHKVKRPGALHSVYFKSVAERDRVRKAAKLCGMTMSAFMREACVEKAGKVRGVSKGGAE